MNLLDGLLTLTAIHFIATLSPGPEFMLISKEALRYGRRAGFLSLAGTMSGLVIHIVYSAFGLAAIISSSADALLAIQIIGGGYLIYLGISGLLSKSTDQALSWSNKDRSITDWQLFKRGLICDLCNPKAPIYYVTLFTFVLSPNMPNAHLAIYGAWIMMIHLIWFSVVVLLLSAPAINRKFNRISHWIDRLLGGAMVAIGIKVLMS
ncbi:LysE family transporter [Amphritea sp. 1_MG-2023]|uniref:LysE family transporter n=1 Tax=Amphritea sp. 1_MG-2023 TaxID=3062670 RepID=UPI0026E13CC4|nr:LysE family transporter [Amphritea sp. 1_MG-2023]MDO6562967.1 LysE family transporter [Amphritea sp. 1_MG-2023]